jgi:2-polyprenyl-3-methyl-5-hydroxy-6-metoxy-1,4-benzoquinol methylase
MLDTFLRFFSDRSERPRIEGLQLVVDGRPYPIRNGIPRFTPELSYSTGNFSILRERHAALQLDSKNGSSERRDLLLERTRWPPSFFSGKTVLECGCGAGPDSEALLSLGANVVGVDIAGLDVARNNLGDRPDLCLIQADVASLPLKPRSFDIVFCHRVLQHTPDPKRTLRHILQYVKPGGAAFVHSYSRDLYQMARWKYVLRPITTRMDSETLYKTIEASAPALFCLTDFTRKYVPLGRHFNWVFIPFLNYSHKPKYKNWSREALIEYGIHDTFDALSPKYDRPLSAASMHSIATEMLDRPFTIRTAAAVTLLATLVKT